MGMSAEQFYQVVLLPQGEFAQFLHADAGDRQRLLQKLFGTDRFGAVEAWLADRRRTTARAVEESEQAVRELAAVVAQVAGPDPAPPADPAPSPDPAAAPGSPDTALPPADPAALPDPAWAPRLASSSAAEADACAARAQAQRTELDHAQERQRAAERLADRQRRRGDALRLRDQLAEAAPGIEERRGELGAALRGGQVTPALEEAARTAAAVTDALQAERQARSALAQIPGARLAATAAELRASGEEHLTQSGRLEGLRSEEQRAAAEDQAAASARAAAAELAAQIGVAEQDAAVHRERRPKLGLQRDQAREAAGALPGVRAEADRFRRAADDMAALVQARADRIRQEEAYVTAKRVYVDLSEEALRLRRARFDGMRAELAATLVDGTPCPVCGSLDHPELCELRGERVTREQEEAADAEAAIAADQAELIGAKLAAADSSVIDLTSRLEGSGFSAPADLPTLEAEAARLAVRANELAGEAAQLTAEAAGLSEVQTGLDALEQDMASAGRLLAELTEQRDAALRQAAEADQRAARHRDSLLAQLGGLPDLDTALRVARETSDAYIAAADAAEAAARAQADFSRAVASATKAAAEAGFADLDDARQALRAADWRAVADHDIREHEARVKAVAELLADPDLDVPLDPPAEVDEATAAARSARTKLDAALAAQVRAEQKAEQLAGLAPQLSMSLQELTPLAARAAEARQLADLAAGQGANTLRMTLSSFVLAARLEEVAAAASQRLLAMTSGRYSLIHTDARRGAGRSGLGLLACDAWTGVDRDTSTLSGGETFLASLALALGLADVVTAEAGGTRIEALFVDEGFGSLDEDTLEEVMTVLDGLREGGRMVGIVSHVAELKQRIPAQVRVHKGHAGSHVTLCAAHAAVAGKGQGRLIKPDLNRQSADRPRPPAWRRKLAQASCR